MLDLLHWYARIHGPGAVRVIQTALSDEAAQRADDSASAGHDVEQVRRRHTARARSRARTGRDEVVRCAIVRGPERPITARAGSRPRRTRVEQQRNLGRHCV